MPNYPINNNLYTYFWNKYRPAVLQLMKEASNGPQEYKFQQHEFKDINPKEKGGYAFVMEIFRGKSQLTGPKETIKKWVVAQDLLFVLQKSAKAMELMDTAVYKFTMDKQFVLHVSCETPASDGEEEAQGEVLAEAPAAEAVEDAATEAAEETTEEEAPVNEEKVEVEEKSEKKEKEEVS